MNNLLKTISGATLKAALPEADLKLLLSSVRDVRSQDAKAADSFYCSLEGVLLELRTVTADNRDAEAFLKPVSRMDYPDYYELIKHPMDLGTMLKNVKARKYKSKQEFASDLSLIWKNCLKYNSGPDHVLRGCVTRLRRKADHLLTHLSDRPDRVTINGFPTPSAPPSSSSSRESPYKPVKINGLVNGIASRDRMSTPDPSTPQAALTPTSGPTDSHSRSKSPRAFSVHGSPARHSPSNANVVPFEDQLALIRTSAGMELFLDLDWETQRALDGAPEEAGMLPMLGFDAKGKGKATLVQRLRDILDDNMNEDDIERVSDHGVVDVADGGVSTLKRKRPTSSHDQRKRPRLADAFRSTDPAFSTLGEREEDLLETWWEAAPSSSLIMGGLPSLPQFDGMEDRMEKASKRPCLTPIKHHKRKKGTRKRTSALPRAKKPSKSLLKLMNSNIATLARVRQTHAKFITLNAVSDPANPAVPPVEPVSEHETEELILAEEGWRVRGEVSQDMAVECLDWMGGKVLQHAGFQGSSAAALSVLTSVAAEYLQNVGRTIRFMCDKHSNTMTPEEIVLHTLFESGTTEIQDLERYIKDDIVRYGGRLVDLEKKLVGAYRDITSVEVPSEEGIFEDGDDADHFASGGLTDILGGSEDFLGLRELGIEAEFGLKSLSIPKRLWKGKTTAEDRAAPDRANVGTPPPPFPPPPPFIPLQSSKLDSQIGLLRTFYQERFAPLAASSAPPLPPDAMPIDPVLPYLTPTNSSNASASSSAAPLVSRFAVSLVLPDDSANPTRAKIGPLGQIIVSNPTSTNKKKGKAKEVVIDKGKDKEPEGPTPGQKKESKKKKGKDEQGGLTEINGQGDGADTNGTTPKKKPKLGGNGKKSGKNVKPPDIPPTITASA